MENLRSASEFKLPDSFWKTFLEEYWKKKPVIFKRPLPQPIVSAREVFRGVIDRFSNRKTARDFGLNVSVESGRLEAGMSKLLPAPGYGCLADYAADLSKRFGGRPFGVSAGHFHTDLDFECWNRFRYFLKPLFDQGHFPRGDVELSLFWGNYPSTGRGVHRDDADVFLFVTEGKKRMRLWPEKYFQESGSLMWLDRDEYEKYNADSIVFDGEPGDVMYWPMTYWHVGECLSGIDSSISVALHNKRTGKYDLVKELHAAVDKAVDAEGLARLPKNTGDALEMMEKLHHEFSKSVRGFDAREEMMKTWLSRLSGYSFFEVHGPRSATIESDDQLFRINPDFPVLNERAGEVLVIAANGHAFSVPHEDTVVATLHKINSGEPVSVKVLSAGQNAKNVRTLLQVLLNVRALRPA